MPRAEMHWDYISCEPTLQDSPQPKEQCAPGG